MCLNLCLFSAVLLGILYLFFGAFELVFTENHGFNLWQVGLSFLGLLVGQVSDHVRIVKFNEEQHSSGLEPRLIQRLKVDCHCNRPFVAPYVDLSSVHFDTPGKESGICPRSMSFLTPSNLVGNYKRLVNKYEKATGEYGTSEPEFRLPP